MSTVMEKPHVELELTLETENDRVLRVRADAAESLQGFADRISKDAEVNGESVLEAAAGVDITNFRVPVGEIDFRHQKIKVRKTCVEGHFESEVESHHFPANAPWAVVHRWGCRKFDVANDACANLELRAGSSTGAPINEHDKIGESQACKPVWLVKPGPEPNG